MATLVMTISRSVTMIVLGALLKRVQVSVHKKDFDLRRDDKQVEFLREMYNLVAQIDMLSSELAASKQWQLRDIHDAAKKIVSLTNKERTKTMSSISITMHSIEE